MTSLDKFGHERHSTLSHNELNAPSTDLSLRIIDELNRAVPGKSYDKFRQVMTSLDKLWQV